MDTFTNFLFLNSNKFWTYLDNQIQTVGVCTRDFLNSYVPTTPFLPSKASIFRYLRSSTSLHSTPF